MDDGATSVLIAGGGVAALEAAIALSELAPGLVDVQILSPDDYFTYAPLAVAAPYEPGTPIRFELAELARKLGATVTHGRLTGIDAWRRLAHTSINFDIEYEVLLIACGAVPMPSVPGASTFSGPADIDVVRRVLDEIARGEARSVAFVVPWGAAWSLPAYELALLTGAHVDSSVELWLVTPELDPLQLFGPPASQAVRELLMARGVGLRSGAYAEAFVDGELRLLPHEPLSVDRVVALPRLVGAPIDGIPQTIEGFIPTDAHGRVHGLAGVYAAGDISTFPVKHGGLAAQQAVAAAEMIAALAGAGVEPQPFRPVVQGLLLTGDEPRYLRRELGGESPHEPVAAYEPLWWPPAKIVGRHLAPFLASHAGAGLAPIPAPPLDDAVAVEAPLEPESLTQLAADRLPVAGFDDEGDSGLVSSTAIAIAAPEDTLGEVAEQMLREDTTAVLVADSGRLIGIVTTHDLMRAFAARAHPSEARARLWMTAEPITLGPDAPRAAAEHLMRAYGIHHLPLVDAGRPVDLLRMDEGERAPLPVGLGF